MLWTDFTIFSLWIVILPGASYMPSLPLGSISPWYNSFYAEQHWKNIVTLMSSVQTLFGILECIQNLTVKFMMKLLIICAVANYNSRIKWYHAQVSISKSNVRLKS